jgi:CoA-transferase family III
MDTRSSGDPAGTEQAGGTRSQGDEGGAAPRLPLHGLRVEAGLWPAAQLAGRLLRLLGADVEHAADGRGCLRSGPATVRATADGVAGDWANSGLAELTGRPDGPGLVPDGAPATFARACGLGIELLTTLGGRPVAVDWAGTLSERARILGLTRGGTVSAGGAARLLRTSDGWCALSLPRAADLDLVPALTAGARDDLGGGAGGDAGDKDSADDQWGLARRWARTVTGVEVEARAGLLGLGVGWVRRPGQVRPRPPWSVRAYETDEMRRVRAVCAEGAPPLAGRDEGRRLVVNLGSLWAAPLCAHLLGDGGFRVVDVESPERPDGSRLGTPAFYQRLHAGHELAVLPLATEEGRRELAALLRAADVVITGSRTASLARLGATRDQVSARRAQSWVSISGHGAESPRIGFGDDAAASGGLLAWDARGPVFAGDAIADPLTGLAAALCAFACLAGGGGSWDVRLSLRDVAAASAALVPATGRRLRS